MTRRTARLPEMPQADRGVVLAPDPAEPDLRETYVMVATTAPVTPGRLCVVQLAVGPVLRRITRRGGVLALRTRAGRFAGTVTPDTPHAAAVWLQSPVE